MLKSHDQQSQGHQITATITTRNFTFENFANIFVTIVYLYGGPFTTRSFSGMGLKGS
jgi:hypothetical protein